MTTGFQQQKPLVNFSFPRAEPQPQTVGKKLEPAKDVPKPRPERRTFR